MSLLLKIKNENWSPESPDIRKFSLRAREQPWSDVALQYYTQELTSSPAGFGVDRFLFTGGAGYPLTGSIWSVWTKITPPGPYPWTHQVQEFFQNTDNTTSATWNMSVFESFAVAPANQITISYQLNFFDGSYNLVFNTTIASVTVPEAVARDWNWTAWQFVIGASEFDLNLWYKNGQDETIVGPISSVFTFASIRALLISVLGYTPAQAAAWSPGPLLASTIGDSDYPGEDAYFYHANVQATSSILSNSVLESIAVSTPPYAGGSFADWPLTWVDGAPYYGDVSGNARFLGPIYGTDDSLGGPMAPVFVLRRRAGGFDYDTARPVRAASTKKTSDLDVLLSAAATPSVKWVSDQPSTSTLRGSRPPASVEVEPFLISGRGGFESALPTPYRTPGIRAGLVEVEPFLISGRGGFEAILPPQYRAPWLQAGLVEVEPFPISGRGGFDAVLPPQYRAPWLQAGLVEVEPFLIVGRGGFEAVLRSQYRATWSQAGLVEVEPFLIAGRGGFEAVLPLQYRAPWLQAGLVEVEPFLISGRGGFEAVLPPQYRAPWQQAGLVEVEPFLISGRGGFDAVLPPQYQAPWPQAGLVEVEPFLITGRGGFEAVLPPQYRAPWLQAGLVEVEPFLISGRGGFEALLSPQYRAPWQQAGLVEVEPFLISGRGGFEAVLPGQRRNVSVVTGYFNVELVVNSTVVGWGFETAFTASWRAPWPQAGFYRGRAFPDIGSWGF